MLLLPMLYEETNLGIMRSFQLELWFGMCLHTLVYTHKQNLLQIEDNLHNSVIEETQISIVTCAMLFWY